MLRKGAIRYLDLLPGIATGVEDANRKLDAQSKLLDELLRRTAQAEGVPLDALRAILTDMGELADTLDAGQVAERLKSKAIEFKALNDRL